MVLSVIGQVIMKARAEHEAKFGRRRQAEESASAEVQPTEAAAPAPMITTMAADSPA
jgi:Flp pilus assembly protein TadD